MATAKEKVKTIQGEVQNLLTKIPTGLAVKRSGSTFTFGWKNADTYNNIKVGYRIKNSTKWLAWHYFDLGGKTTKKSITLANADYWPSASPVATEIEFAVKAYRKSYTETKKGIKYTYNMSWSPWAYKGYVIGKPSRPSLSATLSEDFTNITTFSWSLSEGSTQIVHDVQWQSMLVANCMETNGAKLSWAVNAPGYTSGTGGLSSSATITENTVTIASGSHTRWFRCRGRGKAGSGDWVYSKHVYAMPLQAKVIPQSVNVQTTGAEGFKCYLKWTADATPARPIDKTIVQYSITEPDAGLACPNGASWTDGNVTYDTKGDDAVTFTIDDVLSLDQCLYVRVNTIHDTYTTYGTPHLARVGMLKKPVNLSVDTNASTYRATVHAEHDTGVADAFIVVQFQDGEEEPYDIGIIPSTATETTVQCPQWDVETKTNFYVYECVGSYEKKSKTGDPDRYAVTARMYSAKEERGGDVPVAPQNVRATVTDKVGTVRVEWEWSWAGANSAEISWSDHDDAWESTDEPETYTISNLYASRWNIAGLETGKRWYFRVRLLNTTGDGEGTPSPWSDLTSDTMLDLSSAPAIPVLTLGDGGQGIIPEDGSIVASWVYVSTDSTSQAYAEICDIADMAQLDKEYILSTDTEVRQWKEYFVRSGSGTALDPYVYETADTITEDEYNRPQRIRASGNPSTEGWYEINRAIIAHTETAQSVILDAQTIGWRQGETHQLAVRVKSASGVVSDEWSDPVPLIIAIPIHIDITETSLEEVTIEEDDGYTRTVTALTEMSEDTPFTITVTGAGNDGTTTVAVERAEAYHMDRPDEDIFNGFKGETVLLASHIGEGQFEFRQRDLLGRLDDGASYKIVATIRDDIGQKDEVELPFEVRWEEQAIIPKAWAVVDYNYDAVVIGIEELDGASEGATCDIYRLSVDKPQLIYEGAPLGSKIVDPYPAIGSTGGHRIVYKTINDDYITADNEPAWIDLRSDEDDILDVDYAIINYDRGRVNLAYNIQLSNQWDKDFKETRYLGGAIQGDWNPAVGRSASVSASVIRIIEEDVILGMRRIAVSPAICHIRTPDGSSFPCDIEVSETSGSDRGGKIYDYSLNITRVDPQTLDGMTLEDWEAEHPEEEE